MRLRAPGSFGARGLWWTVFSGAVRRLDSAVSSPSRDNNIIYAGTSYEISASADTRRPWRRPDRAAGPLSPFYTSDPLNLVPPSEQCSRGRRSRQSDRSNGGSPLRHGQSESEGGVGRSHGLSEGGVGCFSFHTTHVTDIHIYRYPWISEVRISADIRG